MFEIFTIVLDSIIVKQSRSINSWNTVGTYGSFLLCIKRYILFEFINTIITTTKITNIFIIYNDNKITLIVTIISVAI